MANKLKTSYGILYILLAWGGCLIINLIINISLMQINFVNYNNYGTMIGTSLFLLFWLTITLRSRENKKLLKVLLALDICGVILAFLCVLDVAAIIEIINWPYMVALIGLENFVNQDLYFKIQILIYFVFGLFTFLLLYRLRCFTNQDIS